MEYNALRQSSFVNYLKGDLMFKNILRLVAGFSLFVVSGLSLVAPQASFAIVENNRIVETHESVATEFETILPSRNESWYTYWGLGFSRPSYSGVAGEKVDQLRDNKNVSNFGLNADLAGFYWPVNNHQTAVGFVANIISDRYALENNEGIQITQYSLNLSGMHFFGANIGSGLFLRADAGVGAFVSSYNEPTQDKNGTVINSRSSSAGFNALGGVGYAVPVSQGARLLIAANYSFHTAPFANLPELGKDNLKSHTVSLTTGLLF
jgi:hypothetical protein